MEGGSSLQSLCLLGTLEGCCVQERTSRSQTSGGQAQRNATQSPPAPNPLASIRPSSAPALLLQKRWCRPSCKQLRDRWLTGCQRENGLPWFSGFTAETPGEAQKVREPSMVTPGL